MELVKLSKYVKEVRPNHMRYEEYHYNRLQEILKYNNFLLTKLSLGLFIPCDKEGKPLEKPENFSNWQEGMMITSDLSTGIWYEECKQYQEAQDRVVFEGFTELYVLSKEASFYVKSPANTISFYKVDGVWIAEYADATIEDLCELGLIIKEGKI